jgi:hypothetical protein
MTDVLEYIQIGSATNQNAAAVMLLEEGQSALLVNTSLTLSMWIGNSPTLTPVYPNAIQILPLSYTVITAKDEPIYGTCLTPNIVTVGVLPGATTFFTTVQAQIGNVYANANQVSVAPSGFTPVGTFNVGTYTSVVAALGPVTNSAVSAGAAICAQWIFTWFDANNIAIASDVVSCIIGWAANFEIPVRGVKLQVIMVNVGIVGTITAPVNGMVIDGSYRVIPSIRAINTVPVSAPVVTGCTVTVQGIPVFNTGLAGINNWLASLNAAWTTGAIVVVPLPLWVGNVLGQYQVVTSALAHVGIIADLTFALQGQVVAGTSYPFGIVANYSAAVAANMPVNYFSPSSQLAFIYQGTVTAGGVELSLTSLATLSIREAE